MTRDEYLRGVAALIKSNQKEGGLKASTLGNLILASLGERWIQHGYPTLKPLLEELERQHKIRLVYAGPGGLSVEWVAGPTSATVENTNPRLRRLRREVWAAFVNELPVGLRAMDRESGEVKTGLTAIPSNDTKWLRIDRVPDDVFKQLARSVIDEANVPELREVLGDPIWFVKVSLEMRRVAPWLHPRWSRMRTQLVFDRVEQWCMAHHVPLGMVLDNPLRSYPEKPPALSPTPEGDEAVRSRILAAIAMMSLDELLEIPIPSKYTMRVSAR